MSKVDLNLTVQMKANSVFIGDICYALDKEIYHKKWGDGLSWADGKIQAEGNGDIGPVCAVVGSTAYGDGSFTGSDGIEYGVDAGVIGVTNLTYCEDGEDVESLNQLGKVVDIPGGECFVTLIDEEGEFYIIIEDMQHNRLYSVNISTGELETPTCIECGAEISDFENYQYGGVCEDCYRYQDYEDEEEDLDECCTANCTSAEFQRMAPGRNAKMIGMKKRSLGKKNKYNTLGEKVLKEKRKARPDEENDLSEKAVKEIVLKSFQEVFEGNENVILPKKLTTTDLALSIQINGKNPFKVAIKIVVNEELGTYALDGLTNKDKKLLPDSYFQGTSLEEVKKDAQAFAKDINKLVKESLKESKKVARKTLKENSLTSDKVLVIVPLPNDYFDKFGNPVGADKYDERLEEIDKALFEAGAETVWDVTSNPEAGWEGDHFSDTGFRRMTVAQLRAVIESGNIEEDEIRVYTNDIDVERDNWSDYMNKHPEIDPCDHTADYDIYEDHRIYDIYSLVFDADDDND